MRTPEHPGVSEKILKWIENANGFRKLLRIPPAGAGGMLGDLTAPSGALSGGGPLGDIGTALAGPLLSAVGLTGQLDQPTIDALKKIHGC